MLKDDLKKLALDAMKAKDSAATQLYRLALGEVQMLEVRTAKDSTDDDVAAILRKLIKSNEETRAATVDEAGKALLARENQLLQAVLPKGLTAAEIAAALGPVAAALREAKSDGQATGVAMKHLKAAGITAPGSEVGDAVKTIRGGT